MAQGHGKDAYFSMDDTGGTPTDVSVYFDSISGLPGGIDMANVTTFTLEDPTFLAGLSSVTTVTMNGPYDSTFDGYVGTDTQKKTARSCVYGPVGNATPKWAFEAFISGYEIVAATTDAARMNVTLTVTGAKTRS